jgi:diguanylate cyclase (GGDEF)-like protein
VIVVDLDRFKQVNETLGFSAGDSILLTLSRRLGRLLKPHDTLARIGGDTFAVILLSEREPDRVLAFAEMVRRALTTPITYAERELFLTASIGILLYDPQAPAPREEILKNAEIALSHARRQGGDRIEVFRPTMRTDRSEASTLEADLRRALDQGDIRVLFKPVVRLEDRTIAGFEAVLRWDHPRLGRMGAEEILPAAEDAGLIVDVSVYALERTARELAVWQQALVVEPPIFASVRMASHLLLRHDLLQDVKTALARSGVLPGSLKLELTEGIVMENPEFSAQLLGRLRDLGAGLSLDDFGTGYSALSYLQRFAFDTIKIDQSFVRQMAAGKPVILRSIIKMAHELGMEVVAEGAETESEVIELSQLGCEYAQGPVFGEPMSIAQARQLVGAALEAA